MTFDLLHYPTLSDFHLKSHNSITVQLQSLLFAEWQYSAKSVTPQQSAFIHCDLIKVPAETKTSDSEISCNLRQKLKQGQECQQCQFVAQRNGRGQLGVIIVFCVDHATHLYDRCWVNMADVDVCHLEVRFCPMRSHPWFPKSHWDHLELTDQLDIHRHHLSMMLIR